MMETEIKERPIIFSGEMVRAIMDGRKTQTRRVVKKPERLNGLMLPGEEPDWCPYGGPGDRLWVRETCAWAKKWNGRQDMVQYRANGEISFSVGCWQGANGTKNMRWTPSIHMPRWASRILLEVTDVFVERLNDMMPESVHKEGMPDDVYFSEDPAAPMDWFANLWNSINEKRNYGWDKNPWVWVVEFKLINPNPESPGDE